MQKAGCRVPMFDTGDADDGEGEKERVTNLWTIECPSMPP